ncbi:MFS transporter [Cupriavidus plantarum]|uniref:Nitrate/nitrite transporter NarK n=1 Tax=Cupriavidus plantarum TaxID=942865 RepID=A0A316F6R9_9BURK|nr:MFS transporter [Cupriavidus plantarum]NYI01439.1 MFS family permease [Cupriavidus plantarum]PWK32661.1 nitrate/nitrite transporter NarK [Cupriavidus plantarum]REE90756.1 nitrate/nitrite transporter NarK [Cupriavidus plantarum]RLK33427.1 nitrate/nitrite transporter NarK [Cupriavidus plantarum]CAG2151557.1 Proline/betaine transporter [Cupriavidus plantarum]
MSTTSSTAGAVGAAGHSARPLTGQDYKTLALAALGGALEFYDFIIFVFFATVIGQLFFPPSMPDWLRQFQTFGIFAAGYLARPLGGIIMAHFGDLLGRKKMFTLSILLMSVPTLAMGLLPTYHSIGLLAPLALLLLRVLQGAAVGGEVPGAWVFVSEHVPNRHVGYACGTLTAGLTAGILLGSLVATGMNSLFTPAELTDWAWRVPFLLGGVFGIASMYLRQWLHETPVFAELQQRKALAAEMPLKSVVRDHRGAVAISMLLTWMLSAGIVVVILMTPTFLQKLFGFDGRTALIANSFATLTLSIGCVVAGILADRFGARRTLFVGGLLLAGTAYLLYTTVGTHPHLLIPLYALAGFMVGTVGAVPYVLVNAFPAQVRFSGLSFSYNVSYAIFGGLTPMIVTLMLKNNPLAPAHYVIAVCLIGIVTALFVKKA